VVAGHEQAMGISVLHNGSRESQGSIVDGNIHTNKDSSMKPAAEESRNDDKVFIIKNGTFTDGLTALSLTEGVAVHRSLRIRATWATSVQWTEDSELTQEIVDELVEQWDHSCGSMINKTAGSAGWLRILPGSTIL
jgi:hypothetical protein